MGLRLTKRKLRAIIEALIARTAGEIDINDDPASPRIDDYEAALEWAMLQESLRNARQTDP